MRTNTKSFVFFYKNGATLPNYATGEGFIDCSEKLLLTPNSKTDTFMIFNGKLGQRDSYSDIGDTTVEGATLSHKVRFQNAAADALDTVPPYGELLKGSGFTETVNTTTPGQETVTYTWNTASAPAVGSMVYFMDGKKLEATNKVASSFSANITVGEPVSFEFALSTFFDNNGIATTEANPSVPALTENVIVAQKVDVLTKDGSAIVGANNISIDMASVINKRYGFGLDEYETSDFAPVLSLEFPVEKADFSQGLQDLQNQTEYDIVIKLGTSAGTEVNGKTIVMTITNVKLSSSSDSDSDDNLNRSQEFIFTHNTAFTIKTGFFA